MAQKLNNLERYELYILDWIYNHGNTMEQFFHEIDTLASEWELTLDETYGEFLDIGFNGDLWVCFGEFMYYENADENYQPQHNTMWHKRLRELQKENHNNTNRLADANISELIYNYFGGKYNNG